MDSFIMVKPTGEPMSEKTRQWTEAEMTMPSTIGDGSFAARRA